MGLTEINEDEIKNYKNVGEVPGLTYKTDQGVAIYNIGKGNYKMLPYHEDESNYADDITKAMSAGLKKGGALSALLTKHKLSNDKVYLYTK